MIKQADWITSAENMKEVCPVFRKRWRRKAPVREASLTLTALGVYDARLNGCRVSEYVLAPGWTSYDKRLQVQRYDITGMLEEENVLTVTVGKGWFRSRMADFAYPEEARIRENRPCGIIGEIRLMYSDGTEELLPTDLSWEYGGSRVRFSEIYDGEVYDASRRTVNWKPVSLLDWSKEILIPQEGNEIREMERVSAKKVFYTPKGEKVVDFGQEVTGYIEFTVDAHEGDRVHLLHGEVLDQKGNFYNENYRSARAEITYVCREGRQTWHPLLTFFGFRYVKLDEFPGNPDTGQFTAVAVYSAMERTGYLSSGDPDLNRLISNIFWGQKGNFLDVPTDCPQRDERLGWTGDAQVFVKTACYNFDAERFFRKWLHDLAADQRPDGGVSTVVPDYMPGDMPSAGWGDAAVICPWQVYMIYGEKKILEDQYDSMKQWVDYITASTKDRYLWTGGTHFGDWLGLDAPEGSYKGSSREDLIASAYYARSAELLAKAGKVLGRDTRGYERLHAEIVRAFRKKFPEYHTQTEHVLAVWSGLSENPQKTADDLAEMIIKDGARIRTGFVGTPQILHVLSRYGHTDLAYTLLLRKKYPSWLYPVEKGATTVWEHWDGIQENGDFWSPDMNSFNHYSYGAVADWIYEEAAGITPSEEAPGFAKVRIAPHPDRRLGWLDVFLRTRHGRVSSKWICGEDGIRYEITADMPATVVIGGMEHQMAPGSSTFWSGY